MLDEAAFENADATGTATGRYWPAATTETSEVDLPGATYPRQTTAVWRYLPRVVN